MKKFLSILLLSLFFAACGPYQKALKSDDLAVKYAAAEKLYDQGKYNKAIRLFEQMSSGYRGKPQAEKMFYMFGQSYYKTDQFYLAGYQLDLFASSYPRSEMAQEAAFLSAKSFANEAPIYSKDQGNTYKAIDKLQAFIDKYPNSTYIAEANTLVQEMQDRLEKKAFEVAKNYHTVGEYNRSYGPAIIALDNFLLDFPGTKYKEEALYYRFDSAYLQAMNSVESKKLERLNNAKAASTTLFKYKADTEYKDEVQTKLAKIEKELQQYSKQI